jgi:mannose-6-phosphate isomerase-like protein (cupin superfamily)
MFYIDLWALVSGGEMKNYEIAQLDEVESAQCPCGTTKRAFVSPENPVYHKKLTEIYLVLEGEGHMELDDEMVPVKPMTTLLIKPGCRHRAVGQMRIVNIPIPAFESEDEWFDD